MNDPPWLKQPCRDLEISLDRGRASQALLIHGLAGTGRRHVARWLAGRLLEGSPALTDPSGEGEWVHPDFLLVQPPEDKDTIAVAQVRDLISFLQLTSHRGGARVVMCHPADTMTREAANSLLKTLEEPPRGSTIILVCSSPAGLPATVVSRCQRLRITPPSRGEALAWLRKQAGDVEWELLLDFAGGAPLAALGLQRSGFAPRAVEIAGDLQALRRRQATPVGIARKWAGEDGEILLRWLCLQAARSLSETVTARTPGGTHLQNGLKPRNMRALFRRLGETEAFYADRGRSLRADLQLASLLQYWHGDADGG